MDRYLLQKYIRMGKRVTLALWKMARVSGPLEDERRIKSLSFSGMLTWAQKGPKQLCSTPGGARFLFLTPPLRRDPNSILAAGPRVSVGSIVPSKRGDGVGMMVTLASEEWNDWIGGVQHHPATSTLVISPAGNAGKSSPSLPSLSTCLFSISQFISTRP